MKGDPSEDLQEETARAIDKKSRRAVIRVVLLIGVLKLFLAFWLELGNDEAYYWLYSQQLQWNYFDHTPMIAIWVRLFTLNLALEGWEGFLRIGSVAGSMVASYFLYRATRLLHSERAGWIAALLYQGFFYSGVTAGLYLMPDAPQMVFWTGALWMLARIGQNPAARKNWLLFGLLSGLAFMSKVHGIFLWSGVLLYAIFYRRSWFRQVPSYLGAAVFCLVISPFIIWNLEHRMASVALHGGRMDLSLRGLNGHSFLVQLLSQISFNNPLNTAIILVALLGRTTRRSRGGDTLRIYSLVALPLILVLLAVSAFMPVTMPHWSGPAWITLIPLASVFLAERYRATFPTLLRWSLGLFLVCIVGYSLVIRYLPGTYSRETGERKGRGDMTLDMYGWREAARSFDSLYRSDQSAGIMPADAFMVTAFWWGAHVDYYFARPIGLRMVGLGKPTQVGQYLWTNPNRNFPLTEAAYCVVPSDERYRVPADWFGSSVLAFTAEIHRSGKVARRFFFYRLRRWKKPIPDAEILR